MRITEDFERREVGMIAGKLRLLAEDVGLEENEVAALIGARAGSWPLPREARLDVCQETRLRQLLEVVERIIRLFGSQAGRWLRKRHVALRTRPIDFLLTEPHALRAIRDALRNEMAD